MADPLQLPFAASRALVVGIQDYAQGLRRLETPGADARALADLLRADHGFDVELLTDDVTRERLSAALSRLLTRVTATDRVLFYFAGHGHAFDDGHGLSGFLVPQDALLGNLESYLPMQGVYDVLDQLPCAHVLAVLDCCFAGAFRWGGVRDAAWPPRVLYRQRYARYVEQPAAQLLASADADQTALDAWTLGARGAATAEGHSPFAAALLQALRGGADTSTPGSNADGVLTATEIYLYLRDVLERQLENRGVQQTPRLWPMRKHGRGEYLFLLPGTGALPDAPPLDDGANPYRGLKPYDMGHSKLFFGRERTTGALEERVRASPLTVVTGPSGSGKSSAMRAGLLPRLADHGWRVIGPFRPGDDPALAFRAAGGETGALAAWLAEDAARRLVVAIDQLEEIFTLSRPAARDRLLGDLAKFLADRPEQARLVVTIRVDDEPQGRATALGPLWDRGRYVVPPLSRAELREVIERPAAEAALELEHPAGDSSLSDRLIDEVFDMPGGLPLLSFTLSELYRRCAERHRDGDPGRVLTIADWSAMHGVAGALEQRAEKLWTDRPELRETLRRLALRMVTLARGDLVRRRVSARERELDDPAERARVEQVIAELVEARLVVVDADAVEPAHDALVRGWPRLREWLGDDAVAISRRVTAAEEEWSAAAGADDRLWDRDPRLGQALLAGRRPSWFNRHESEFLRRSAARRRRRLITAIAAVAALLLTFASLAAYSFWQRDRARRGEARAVVASRENLARALVGQSAALLAGADERLAPTGALLAVLAQELRPSSEGDRTLRDALVLLPPPVDPRGAGGAGEVADLVEAPGEGLLIAVGGGQVRLFPAAGGAPSILPVADARRIALSADERVLAIADGAGDVHLLKKWPSDHPQPRVIHTGVDVERLELSGKGGFLLVTPAAATPEQRTRLLWDAVSGQELTWFQYSLDINEGALRDIVMSGDEQWLATVRDAEEPPTLPSTLAQVRAQGGEYAHLWSVPDQSPVRIPSPVESEGHLIDEPDHPIDYTDAERLVPPVAFSDDGRLFFADTREHGVALWEAGVGGRWKVRFRHEHTLQWFSRLVVDGRQDFEWGIGGLVSGGLRLWSTDGSELFDFSPRSAETYQRPLSAIALSDDTSTLAAAFAGGGVRVWSDMPFGHVPSRVVAIDDVRALRFIDHGRRLVTIGARGATVSALGVGEEHWRVDGPVWAERSSAFLDAHRLAAVVDGELRLVDLDARKLLATVAKDQLDDSVNRIATDGRRLILCGTDKVWSWDGQAAAPALLIEVPKARAIVPSPDGRAALAVPEQGDDFVILDLAAARARATIAIPTRPGARIGGGSVAVSAQLIVIGQGDVAPAELYDLDGARRATVPEDAGFPASERFALSADGRRLVASAPGGGLRVFDLDATGTPSLRARMHMPGEVRAIALSADGKRVAATDREPVPGGSLWNGAVHVWDADSGAPIASPPTRFDREAMEADFSPDGRFLAVAGERGIWLLRLHGEDLRDAVCARVGRELEPAEWATYAPGATPHRICPAAAPSPPSQ